LFIVQEEDDTQKLWLVDLDGTNKSLLTTLNGENTRFLWLPNGNRILYTSNESGNYDIWIMDSHGTGKKQLTSTPENEYAMGIAFPLKEIKLCTHQGITSTEQISLHMRGFLLRSGQWM